MKNLRSTAISRLNICLIACSVSLLLFSGGKKDDETPQLSVTTVASGLAGPMGIETTSNGNILVSEVGTDDTVGAPSNTYKDNGKVVLITPDGQKYDMVINLSPFANVHSGEL